MDQIFISLGSNLGDRQSQIETAKSLLAEASIKIIMCSPLYISKAWGITDQPDFYNQIIQVKTTLSPEDLMALLLDIELKMGRRRDGKWKERSIDLDLLFYGKEIRRTRSLTIPHPMIETRNFILTPMMDLSPHLVHPILGQTIQELYLETPDDLEVLMCEING